MKPGLFHSFSNIARRSASESSNAARSFTGWAKPLSDVFSVSRSASNPARSSACSSGVIGRLLSGVHQLAVRWYTVTRSTSSRIVGTTCTPLDEVPMTATRLPVKSTGVRRPATGVVLLTAEVARVPARRGGTAPRAHRSRR